MAHSSASQVDTYESCGRKWALDKIDKIPRKGNKYAQKGTQIHKVAEEWLRDGIPVPLTEIGEIFMPAIPHLPPPNTPGLQVEVGMGRTLGGIHFKGFMDLRIPYPYREVPIVYDHKSTTDFKWALKGDDPDTGEGGTMHTVVQPALYAWDTLLDSQEAGYKGDVVDLQWTYVRTRGAPKAKVVTQRVSLAMIQPRIDKTEESAVEQRILRETISSGLELPPNASACEAYGGCPYIEVCSLTPSQRIRSIMSQGNAHQAFMKRLNDQRVKAGTSSPAPHPAPADPPPKTVPAKSGTVNPPEAPPVAPAAPSEDTEAPPPAKSKPRAKTGKKASKKAAKPAPPEAPPEAPPVTGKDVAEAAKPAPKPKLVVVPPTPAPQPPPAVQAVGAVDPMSLVRGLLEAAKDGRAIVVMVIPNGGTNGK